MTKKRVKVRQKKYIEKGMNLKRPVDESDKKGKKHIRKPKMPARFKKTPRDMKK